MQELWTSVPVVCDGSFEMKVAILEEKKTFKLSSELMQELWTSVPVVYDRSVVVKVAIQGIISPSSKLMQELWPVFYRLQYHASAGYGFFL